MHDAVTELCGLPARAVRVHRLAELPRLANGKPDLAALERQARLLVEETARSVPTATGEDAIRDDFAVVLGRPDAGPDDSFVGLGGDSLSYVELATRLGRRLGDLPHGWHTRTIRELAADDASRPRAATTRTHRWPWHGRGVRTDSTVVLRALAILAIVATHANLVTIMGGAHLLLAVAGFNFARFQLASVPRRVPAPQRPGRRRAGRRTERAVHRCGGGDHPGVRRHHRRLPARTARQRHLDRRLAVLVPGGPRLDLARGTRADRPPRRSTGSSGGRRSASRWASSR